MKGRLVSLGLALVLLCGCAGPAAGDTFLAGGARSRCAALLEREKPRLDDLLYGRVPQGPAVDPSWFNDAAFVGDSVSVMLEYYNNSTHALGNPAFFCVESLNPRNAMRAEAGSPRLPEWPKGSGERPLLQDGIAQSGASKIYVMLGINSISGGVDNALRDLVTLIDLIQASSPQAAILIQPVTPMTSDSPRADDILNNWLIQDYDQALIQVCRDHGWYYVDVYQIMADEYGALWAEYSGDKSMGIHMNFAGAAAWADYLLTHVPIALR